MLIAAVALVAGAIASLDSGDHDAAPPPPAPGQEIVPNYRVVYEVRETAGDEPLVTTEIVEVRRPFDARVETWTGGPPGGDLLSVTVTNRSHFWHFQQGGEVELGVRRQPGPAHRDASLAVLRQAAGDGMAEEGRRASVAGLPCTRFVYHEPRPSPVEAATADDRVESCVSGDGVVLREVWTLMGRVVLTREAVQVDTDLDLPDSRFLADREPDPSRPSEVASALERAQVVREDVSPEFPVLQPQLPEGFSPDRQAMLFDAGGGGLGPRQAYFQSFVRGMELVVVEQGRTESGTPPWSGSEGRTVDLDGFAAGRLVYFPDHVEVRAEIDGAGRAGGPSYVLVRAPSVPLARYVVEHLEAPG